MWGPTQGDREDSRSGSAPSVVRVSSSLLTSSLRGCVAPDAAPVSRDTHRSGITAWPTALGRQVMESAHRCQELYQPPSAQWPSKPPPHGAPTAHHRSVPYHPVCESPVTALAVPTLHRRVLSLRVGSISGIANTVCRVDEDPQQSGGSILSSALLSLPARHPFMARGILSLPAPRVSDLARDCAQVTEDLRRSGGAIVFHQRPSSPTAGTRP